MSRLSFAGSRLDIYIHIQKMYIYADRKSYDKMNVLLAMKKKTMCFKWRCQYYEKAGSNNMCSESN